VATEYRYHDRADFAVDVVLMGEDELRDELSDLVQVYRTNHFNSADMQTNEDRTQQEKKLKVAHDTLEAMFANRPWSRMLRSQNISSSQVLETLLAWARDLNPASRIETHTVVNTLEECSDLLGKLTSTTTSTGENEARGSAALWPYIKKIRCVLAFLRDERKCKMKAKHCHSVCLNAFILSKGLVLVDLPGRSITSPSRLLFTASARRAASMTDFSWS
jgi:hypothetical protein